MDQFENKIKFSLNIKVKDNKKQYIGIPKQWNELNESVIKKSHKHKAILTGEKNGITVVDFDKEKGMEYFNKYKDLIKDTFIETSYSGYKHAYFEYDEDLQSKTNNNETSIDILNNGRCCNMGIDNNGNQITKIPREFKEFLLSKPISDTNSDVSTLMSDDDEIHSEVSDDFFNPEFDEVYSDVHSEASASIPDDLPVEVKVQSEASIIYMNKIKDLVKIIDVKYSDNRSDWIKIGMCLKNIVNDNDEAFDIWNDFSKLSKNKYNIKDIKKEWTSLKKENDLSIKVLYNYAKENKKEMKEFNKKYKKEEKEIIINKIPLLNKFDLKNEYCFCTLKDYLYYNKFKDIASIIEYLELNLHKVCARVDDYMITKKPIDEFNNIHAIESFHKGWRAECLVKYWKYNEKLDCDILQKIPLRDFLEDYPHLINSFYKVNTEFITKDQVLNKKEFYITEQFQAIYIENLNDNDISQIQPLLDMIMVVYCNNDKELYNLIMMLFSFWVCNPNFKSGKCLILTGPQGCGKTTIIDLFSEFIFGKKIILVKLLLIELKMN